MEFNRKLQELRKRKGLTQEELAEALFVSRTAISKWESGKGYPNIDSLKALAKFFGVTVDELLSGDELLTIAEEDTKQKEFHLRDLVFGLLDVSILMLLFLPFFGQNADGVIQGVGLLSLTQIAPYLKVLYYVAVLGMGVCGILTLALQNWENKRWAQSKHKISLLAGIFGVVLFVISLQPYAAVFLLSLTAIKALMLIKWKGL